jgi:ubiquinone/menaquinone biosynthesis C-methylase UbiE
MNDQPNEEREQGPIVRDRYRPAEFDAERYSRDNLAFWTPIMVRLGRIRGRDHVLDVGCATGGLTASIAEATHARLVGCDHSIAMLEYARGVRRGSSVQWVQSDAVRFPFADESYDRVVASLVVHQISDRQRALREFSRVLRSTGVLLVRTVTPEAAANWMPHGFFPSVARAQAERMPRIHHLTEMLRGVGFVDVVTKTVVRHTRLELDDVERALRIEVADRYPFLDQDEFDRGLVQMREHWARNQGVCVDARESTFVIAAKA